MTEHKYKGFRQFNKTQIGDLASASYTINAHIADQYFTSKSLQDRLVQELAKERVLPVKEILESFEFFERVRKHVRTSHVTDLCCGHGLTGILFALFERSVKRVTLLDRHKPRSHAQVLASAVSIGPWVADKVRYQTTTMKNVSKILNPSTSIIGVHACGSLTDHCINHALKLKNAVAVMPCCYSSDHGCKAPTAIRLAFGPEQARDIDRTYRLQNAGYQVRWDYIPREITPMNRVLIGTKSTD